MDEAKIAAVLRQHGDTLLAEPFHPVEFTNDPSANALLNDLQGYPHALVLACLMDRQCPAEVAWAVPFRFKQRFGSFLLRDLETLSLAQVQAFFVESPPLHRMKNDMASIFHAAVQHIAQRYCGNAALIWEGRPGSATLVRRFLEFKGAGPKIATMAANILYRDFKVSLSDMYYLDISPDVHVCRVFERLGLAPRNASTDLVIYAAREWNLEYPGVFDLAAWEIGRQWCRPGQPECGKCYMQAVCAFAGAGSGATSS
jgi:endonuclease-3